MLPCNIGNRNMFYSPLTASPVSLVASFSSALLSTVNWLPEIRPTFPPRNYATFPDLALPSSDKALLFVAVLFNTKLLTVYIPEKAAKLPALAFPFPVESTEFPSLVQQTIQECESWDIYNTIKNNTFVGVLQNIISS
eukprot:TRINITY_DN2204_c0_g1_i7.p2 TRINITY_DN2204_c0_g1~~TRINITY_DN2204_c0_g1_i7.p2  ORF type:complete len:138 (-),score=16.17 TRINITY_DN2204_c0_g1_i7:75-488(-)